MLAHVALVLAAVVAAVVALEKGVPVVRAAAAKALRKAADVVDVTAPPAA